MKHKYKADVTFHDLLYITEPNQDFATICHYADLDHNLVRRKVGITFKKIEVLRGCMGRMTPYSREIIRLRYTEELPGIQVASILNRKVDTIYKALTRIHTTLRSCMKSRLNSATF